MAEMCGQRSDKLDRGFRNIRARRENCLGSGIAQGVKILRRDYAADNHHHIFAFLRAECGAQFGNQSQMSGGQRTDTDNMRARCNCILRGLLGGLNQGARMHFKAQIGKGRGDHFLAAVMAVLSHFGKKD